MQTKVIAPKNYPLDLKLANGLHVFAPPGGEWNGDLTGDQAAYVAAWIKGKENDPQIRAVGGSVVCKERDASDAAPPAGSKRWRTLVAEGTIKPTKTEVSKYALSEDSPAPPAPQSPASGG